MSRSYFRQETQIGASDAYDDTVSAGASMESAPVSGEDDFNSIRSQINRAYDATAGGNWYDAIPVVNAKTRGLLQLNTDTDTLEIKPMLFRTAVLTDVTVTAAQNWEVLSVAGSEAPTLVAAVGAVNTEGAVVAQATSFGAHNLDLVAGPDALNPFNLCLVVDATTQDPITSGGLTVFALLHSEDGVNGHTFDDATQQVQLSFVRVNPAGDALEACPVVDIAGLTIEYSYTAQKEWLNIPKGAFLSGSFVDNAAAVDVTRQNAYTNQAATVVTTSANATLDLGAGLVWEMGDNVSAPILRVVEGNGGSTSEFEIGTATDLYDNNAIDVDFASGIKAASGSTQIDIGTTAGYISTTGAVDLGVRAGQELLLDDGNQSGSTWAQVTGIKLSETTAEWDAFELRFGEVSLLNAIVEADKGAGRDKTVGVLTANVTAATNVTGAAALNLDAQLGDYSGVTFLTDVDVFVNGQLQRNDASTIGANDHDVYPGTAPATGDLKFEYNLVGTGSRPDVITMVIWGS